MSVPTDTPIVNPSATETPSNYEICQRTGFRVPRGTLAAEWNGTLVRRRSHEKRHPLDVIRLKAERAPRELRNPEPTDRFVEDDYPSGVSQADL